MKKVLVVDDDPLARESYREILNQKGYDVLLAASGEEALSALPGSNADVVVLDVLLPGLSGFEVCRRIRLDPATQALPVILLTAKGQAKDLADGKEAGSDLYLVKPVLAGKLVSAVESMVAAGASRKPRFPA